MRESIETRSLHNVFGIVLIANNIHCGRHQATVITANQLAERGGIA